MTAPFAPPPPRPVLVILAVLAIVALVVPFARRDDWIGWLAFGLILACAIVLWSMLLWGMGRSVFAWWRTRS